MGCFWTKANHMPHYVSKKISYKNLLFCIVWPYENFYLSDRLQDRVNAWVESVYNKLAFIIIGTSITAGIIKKMYTKKYLKVMPTPETQVNTVSI